METKEKRFSCFERVLMNTKEVSVLPEFNRYVKMASGFGGGVSGRGSICGAISGAVMALNLRYGTDGTEDYEKFNEKRVIFTKDHSRIHKRFRKRIWGSELL